MKVATRKGKAKRLSGDAQFGSYLVPRRRISPDFTDESLFADGARIRDRLNAPDLDANVRDTLELDEREHALKYWGF
jgi:hypothetical protein